MARMRALLRMDERTDKAQLLEYAVELLDACLASNPAAATRAILGSPAPPPPFQRSIQQEAGRTDGPAAEATDQTALEPKRSKAWLPGPRALPVLAGSLASPYLGDRTGFVIFRPDLIFLDCNEAFCKLVGNVKSQVVGASAFEINVPEDEAATLPSLYAFVQGATKDVIIIKRIRTFRKETVWVKCVCTYAGDQAVAGSDDTDSSASSTSTAGARPAPAYLCIMQLVEAPSHGRAFALEGETVPTAAGASALCQQPSAAAAAGSPNFRQLFEKE
jgi:PAS domain-containing protein